MILETPAPDKAVETDELALYWREINLLYEIQGVRDEEWGERKDGIEAAWRLERDRMNPPKPPKEKKVKTE